MTQHAADRRRIYLMRHGSVDYFHADGTIAHPESVPLNAQGQAQAQAAGELFRASAVRFDRVVASGLPRTVETATRVLEAAGQPMAIGVDAALHEMRGGRLADIAGDLAGSGNFDDFSSAIVESEVSEAVVDDVWDDIGS